MKILAAALLCLIVAACASQSNKMSYALAERSRWRQPAEAGNAEAQFRLGEAYCCGKSGFFDTDTAVHWWCKAARQGHSKARLALEAYKRLKSCAAER